MRYIYLGKSWWSSEAHSQETLHKYIPVFTQFYLTSSP